MQQIFPFDRAGMPYGSPGELLEDGALYVCQCLRRYLETGEALAGRDAEMERQYARGRLAATDGDGQPLLKLARCLGLDDFEQNAVLLTLVSGVWPEAAALVGEIQGRQGAPGVELACALFSPRGLPALQRRYFAAENLFTGLFLRQELAQGSLRLMPDVENRLLGGEGFAVAGIAIYYPERIQWEQVPIRRAQVEALAAQIQAGGEAPRVLALHGEAGSGKHFLLRRALDVSNRVGVFADAATAEKDPALWNAALREALLSGGVLCVEHFEASGRLPEAGREALRRLGVAAVLSRVPWSASFAEGFVALPQEATLPDEEERLALWKWAATSALLGEDVRLEEFAVKFHFYPRQILSALKEAKTLAGQSAIDAALLHRCCYGQATHKLDALATRVRPVYQWDDLVLPEAQCALMREACAHIQYRHTVYHTWGFERAVSYGRGLSMLFSGPPGTGKTMAAQIIANQLHMEMYQIQLSQVVSKYVGETEKNLRAVFQEARRSNGILFFDECDALFGKRSEVKEANDRYANAETAYLLQQIEEYDGVCILATNLMQNIDAAFLRRIRFVVHFPFPDAATRKALYQKMMPPEMPRDDKIDLDFMAEKFPLAGGNIRSIVLQAAFLAAAQGTAVGMAQLLRAAVNEMQKNEIIVVREDLREYADLIW
ncbi:MAG: AAA family ATPase [Eubacteriales bacterium]|nr:AAA family ATPase [Eubacteriales bacterium]